MKALIIKNVFEEKEVLFDVFKSLLKINKIEDKEEYIILYFAYDNDMDIIHALRALEGEMSKSIHAYISLDSTDIRLSHEIEIMIPVLDELPYGIYTFRDAVLKMKYPKNPSEILNFVLEGSGVNEGFIKEFAENDLNVSQASKAMFIHRNTLIYKLNKLKASTGFDLTRFKDAFILYSLVENK